MLSSYQESVRELFVKDVWKQDFDEDDKYWKCLFVLSINGLKLREDESEDVNCRNLSTGDLWSKVHMNLRTEGVFLASFDLVKMKNVFVPVKHVFSVNTYLKISLSHEGVSKVSEQAKWAKGAKWAKRA